MNSAAEEISSNAAHHAIKHTWEQNLCDQGGTSPVNEVFCGTSVHLRADVYFKWSSKLPKVLISVQGAEAGRKGLPPPRNQLSDTLKEC